MRADRLVAALLVLQARGRVTAAQLAAELEVSVPTARRDLEALSAAGVPVYPQPGRGGGWQLVGGARTDLTGLTAGEARALFALLGPARPVGAVGEDGDATRAALRKLLRALPATFRAEAQAAAEAVVVDPAGWGGSSRGLPEQVEPLREAVVSRRRLELAYVARDGAASTRTVDPWGLVAKDGVWYLVAGTDRGRRTFRVDRVRSVRLLDEPATRPGDLDLGQEWDEVAAEVEQRRAAVVARIRFVPGARPMLRRQFGRQFVPDPREGDAGKGDAREGDAGEAAAATVAGLTVDIVARTLASFADSVEVLSPPEVRARLAEIGRLLVAANHPR